MDAPGSAPLKLHLQPDEPDEGIRTAVRESHRDLKQLRRQRKNTLHVVFEVFAKQDRRAQEVVNPFKSSHGSIIKKFKCNDVTLAWHEDVLATFFLRPLEQLAARVALAPGDAFQIMSSLILI